MVLSLVKAVSPQNGNCALLFMHNFLLYVLDVISAGVGSHPPRDNELLRQHDCEGDAEAFTP